MELPETLRNFGAKYLSGSVGTALILATVITFIVYLSIADLTAAEVWTIGYKTVAVSLIIVLIHDSTRTTQMIERYGLTARQNLVADMGRLGAVNAQGVVAVAPRQAAAPVRESTNLQI